EVFTTSTRDDLPKDDSVFWPWRGFSSLRANEKGEFTINNVYPGHYRIGTRLTDETLYVKTITFPSNVPARSSASAPNPGADMSVSREGLALKQGEKRTDITVTVTEGAASLRGKIVAEKAGARLPERLRAHLIPAEPNAADDALRYAEATVSGDGAFAL